MKVLIVLPKLTLGGVETCCENLACALLAAGHEPAVIALYRYESAISKRIEEAGIKLHYLDKKPGADFSMYKKLRKIIRAEKPDVIHTHLYVTKYVIPASFAIKAKRVHTMHNIASEENLTKMGNFLNHIFFKLCKVQPVAISEKVRATTSEMFNIPEEKIPIVFNGIPLNRCMVKESTEIADKMVILNIGRFTEQKNQIALIDAMHKVHEKHPEAELHIYGEGELQSELEERIGDASYIKLCGLIGHIYPVLHDADIFALPSTYEGLPMTLIEAMGTGLPIVASAVGGVPELISDGETGFICETNAQSIADKINECIEKSELRADCAKSALEKSRCFSSEAMAEGYVKIYQG